MRGWAVSVVAALSLLVASGAQAAGANVDAATPEQAEQAQRHFAEGDALYDVQRYEEAVTEYQKSYDIVASPNSRLMVARALQELGRLDEAFHEYGATLDEAEALSSSHEAYARTAEAARHELEALKSRVAWLTVQLGDVPPGSDVTVAGKPVQDAALAAPIVVVPGPVAVEARAPDGRVARATVHLAAGRESSVTLKLGETVTVGEPASPPPPPVAPPPEPTAPAATAAEPPRRHRARPAAYAATAVGVAGLATFGVFGARSSAAYSGLEDDCPDGICPADSKDDIDAGRRDQRIANIALGVGIAGTVAGVTLFVVGSRRPRTPERAALVLRPGALAVEGRFR
jgi:septum formation inhibitor MinC